MYKNKSPNLYRPTFVCAIVEVAPGKYEVANVREVRHPGEKKADNHYCYPHNMYF